MLPHLTTSRWPWDAASSRGVAPAAFVSLMSNPFSSSPDLGMGGVADAVEVGGVEEGER